jgi:hypothetical protein
MSHVSENGNNTANLRHIAASSCGRTQLQETAANKHYKKQAIKSTEEQLVQQMCTYDADATASEASTFWR